MMDDDHDVTGPIVLVLFFPEDTIATKETQQSNGYV